MFNREKKNRKKIILKNSYNIQNPDFLTRARVH